MIIRDKQDLRRCVKQAVRRAEAVETRLDFDVRQGRLGVDALMDGLLTGQGGYTPLQQSAVEAFAALNAMDLPAHDVGKAQAIAQGYDREAYLSQVLGAMHARRVLVAVPMAQAEQIGFADERLAPLLIASPDAFAPGCYGVDYTQAARAVAAAAHACGARDIALDVWDEPALRYALAPLCEDECFVLHLQMRTREQVECLSSVMDGHAGLRVLACGRGHAERALLEAAVGRPNLLVRADRPERLGEAVALLGTRVLAYSACAQLPERMLGRWSLAREQLWQALYAMYLPLARAGYELTDDAIERDAARLMGGAYLELHTAVSAE